MLLTCIDYRLTRATVTYMDGLGLTGKYDQFILVGAALGVQNDGFPAWAATFWQTLDLAIQLHHISRVIAIDHRDCGGYRLALGVDLAANPDEETAVHTARLTALKTMINERYPRLEVDLGLMALDGSVLTIAAPSGGGI